MPRFSDYTLSCLRKAGWTEGRRVDPARFIEIVEARGFQVFPALNACLQEFGGLVLKYSNQGANPLLRGTWDEIRFDPSHASSDPSVSELIPMDGRAAPIGDACRHHSDLIMVETGDIFTAFEDDIFHIGSSCDEAIEALIAFSGR